MGHSDILTSGQCEKILEKYTGSKNFNLKYYHVVPLQSQLEGMMCEQYFLKINYKTENGDCTVQFFLKMLCESNPVMFEITRSIYAYEKEALYYETIIPLFKSKGFSTDYVPKCYLSEPYIIALEDLSQRCFKGTPKNEPLDLFHCKKSLEILARFHAEPILYELKKSEELGREYSLLDEFGEILEDKVFSKEENGATRFMRSSVKGLFFLIDLIPENGVSKTEFQTALQSILEQIMNSKEVSAGYRSTLLHGDLWSNNFLYQYRDNEIIDCVLLDFQTLKYGPPAVDVCQFLFTNTRKSFREEHQDELLTHYYNFFRNLLLGQSYEVDEVINISEFQRSCEAFALVAKIQAIVDRSITFMSNEHFLEAAKSEESFSKYIFEDRGKYIVSGFNKNEEYRELMIEDITELRDMIFDK